MGQRSNWSCMFLISFGFHTSEVALISWSALKKGFDCLIQFWSQSHTLLQGTYKWLPLVPVSSKEKSRGIHFIASWTTGRYLKLNFYSSPAKSSSSEELFGGFGSWQEKYPSFSVVRVNIITLLCTRVKSWTGRLVLLPGILTKKSTASSIGNVSLRHLNVMVLPVRPNVRFVHLPNVQKNNRTRTTNTVAYLFIAAITCSSQNHVRL